MHDQIDVGELVHGFQQGKALALQDWRMRKEQRAFDRFVLRLKSLRRYHAVMAEGKASPRYKLMRASANRANRKRARAHRREEARRVKAWRMKKRREAATVIECRGGCGSTWCAMLSSPTRYGNMRALYCSTQCRNRARYQRAKDRKFHQHDRAIDTTNDADGKGLGPSASSLSQPSAPALSSAQGELSSSVRAAATSGGARCC